MEDTMLYLEVCEEPIDDELKDISEDSDDISISEYMTENNSIGRYYNDIKGIPLLSKEEERDLAVRAKNGDRFAYDKLVNSNLRLVLSLAIKIVGKNNSVVSVLDAVQEGNIGLMKAAKTYDVTKDVKFSTYASCLIKRAIYYVINKNAGVVKFSSYMIGEIKKYKKALDELTTRFGRAPTDGELLEEMDVSAKRLEQIKKAANISKDLKMESANEDNKNENIIMNAVPDLSASVEETVENKAERESARIICNKLTPMEKKIIGFRFGLNDTKCLTVTEVSEKLGISPNRVIQIELKAIRRMKREGN